MADKKISALTGAATPLAGTEVLPIVQSGATVKVSISDVTAGRQVALSSAVAGTGLTAIPWVLNANSSFYQAGSISSIIGTAGIVGVGTELVRNAYYDSGWKYAGGGSASRLVQTGGQLINYRAVSGTANAAVTWIQNLTVDASDNATVNLGNLVIGTTAKGITTGSAIPLGLGVNNTVTAITIDTASNVGVGAASPAYKLDVAGQFRSYSTPSSFAQLQTLVQYTGSAGPIALGQGSDATGYLLNLSNTALVLGTNSVERLRIDAGGNVGIGATPAATAILDVQSTTKGVRFPNMTTTQKNAITPSAGTVIFDTTLSKLCVYSGAAWQTITSV